MILFTSILSSLLFSLISWGLGDPGNKSNSQGYRTGLRQLGELHWWKIISNVSGGTEHSSTFEAYIQKYTDTIPAVNSVYLGGFFLLMPLV